MSRSTEIRSIVIADGLTRDVLSPDHPHRASQDNVGDREIERLIGRGKGYGDGPLPTFLRAAAAASSSPSAIGLVLLSQPLDAAQDNDGSVTGESFIEPISEAVAGGRVVAAEPGRIPAEGMMQACSEWDLEATELRNIRFLIVGCHTDRRILGLASFVRNVWGCGHVAVSPHLVASATQEAHLATLRHTLPGAGVNVILDLGEAADYVGLERAPFERFECHPVEIEPREIAEELAAPERRIVELLCLHWTRVRLRPLAGGYSGSRLFIADGWKGGARTEPLVVKIDDFGQMRRELTGYHQVKDFFGKHVPTFGYPVAGKDSIGVGMDLASMEGRPETLQDTFEAAEGDEGFGRFLHRLDKALGLLSEKLYGNTLDKRWVVPYRAYELHTEQQLVYLRRNTPFILSYLQEAAAETPVVDPRQIERLLPLIAGNEDGVQSETCLVHGDLNFANVICDDVDNIWFIDWTHSGQAPLEKDFNKLESDVKFVMSKEFEFEDLQRLRAFEEYLLSVRLPANAEELPEALKFVKWDLRFRKILEAVRRIRATCFALKDSDDWLVYRVGLLRYALHTLSFDQRRGRGECAPPQLAHALYSALALAFDLAADDFHLKIRAERPASYPPRLRVSIDEAPWLLECPDYDPPYHVDQEVLDNDRMQTPAGWADPEDITLIAEDVAGRESRFRDDDGRPLNPHGRTGIAGRGLLGLWGPNLAVAVVVVRSGADAGGLEILLGGYENEPGLSLPQGFVLPEEPPADAIRRVLTTETGWDPAGCSPELVHEGFTYDARQTDHAWVDGRAFLLRLDASAGPRTFEPAGDFDEIGWWPLDAATVNRVPSRHAPFIRDAVQSLSDAGELDPEVAEALLTRTG